MTYEHYKHRDLRIDSDIPVYTGVVQIVQDARKDPSRLALFDALGRFSKLQGPDNESYGEYIDVSIEKDEYRITFRGNPFSAQTEKEVIDWLGHLVHSFYMCGAEGANGSIQPHAGANQIFQYTLNKQWTGDMSPSFNFWRIVNVSTDVDVETWFAGNVTYDSQKCLTEEEMIEKIEPFVTITKPEPKEYRNLFKSREFVTNRSRVLNGLVPYDFSMEALERENAY